MKRKIIAVPFRSWSMYHRNTGQKNDSLESVRSLCMEKKFLIVKPSTFYATLFLVTINLKEMEWAVGYPGRLVVRNILGQL